ncbi:hypothetical protein [Nocardia sp. NPDC005825]|uniref:hypothetical protein n=1 Tax=unclassified Nocardia TaxID=2637762 RepID=UPI0033DF1916
MSARDAIIMRRNRVTGSTGETSAIIFEFSRHPDEPGEPGPTGFDFGDMDVVGDLGSASSGDGGQSMMIFLSVTMLLDELSALIERGRGGFDWMGISSGFSLNFTLMKGRMRVRAGRVEITDTAAVHVLDAVQQAVREFAARQLPLLDAKDIGRNDLEDSMASYSRAVQRYAEAEQTPKRPTTTRKRSPRRQPWQ